MILIFRMMEIIRIMIRIVRIAWMRMTRIARWSILRKK